MKHRKPKSSYVRPQFSILWAGVVCICLYALLLAVMVAMGADILELLVGSAIVVVLIAAGVLCIELASRFIPYARRNTKDMTDEERLTLYHEFERRRNGPPEDAFESASPFGPPRPTMQATPHKTNATDDPPDAI